MKKIMLSWIAFHGITDIFYDYFIIFYLLVPLSIKLPMDVLNTITLVLSVLHFSDDNVLPLEVILYMLPILLYFGEYRISQHTMLGYLSFIHVPIQLSYTFLYTKKHFFSCQKIYRIKGHTIHEYTYMSIYIYIKG